MIIKVQDSAKKDLKKIDKSIALKILSSIEKLENYPEISNIKKLKNYNPSYRYRVGDYRVLFDIEENDIIIIKIRHRKEVYR